ncbi:double-strand break repair helicase AddA [Pinisolibacter sp.]|uniref:double-strand break repair helicase AddA n=1 Tax=Pinisolibacter sp. TaxID=2172024 RepID=UPI002FDEAA8F
MSAGFTVPQKTTDDQRRAAAPRTSAWVSANAGSGKTYVLARRVVRLLLAGNPASRILCLTFTKAAAATMANRVYKILGDWAVLDDATLAAEIDKLEGEAPRPERLAAARRLFAAAIETPGGLKIQTIHGFCERILQQFPLEADLGGAFDILDATAEADLIAAARDAVLVRASTDDDTPLGRALAELLAETGEAVVLDALASVIGVRDLWRQWLRDTGMPDDAFTQLAGVLAIDPALTAADFDAECLASPEIPEAYASRLAAAWGAGGKRDGDQADRLARARDAALPLAVRAEAWASIFLTKAGEAKADTSIASKAAATVVPDVFDRARAEAERLKDIADRRARLATLRATGALLTLADAVIGEYELRKRRRDALDFDDLVGRTADLLSRSDAAQWVQYKLDKGIDHVLVDEAQDTSPRQWRIVRSLTEEFFAGEGARTKHRTIFAVGDEKQSIYSFQGAAPHAFSETRRDFARKVAEADGAFADVKLDLSFRSTADVLAAVDRVFAGEDLRGRLLADPADYVNHAAARAGAPGLVEIWPMIVAEKAEAPADWLAPIDRSRHDHPWEKLARGIADEIARLTRPGFVLEGTGAPVAYRDIIVLVRKRGPFVEAMNRVLKERGIPVAGQDRLRLTDHIAIADLLALGRALVLPEDDLSLAAVLKSPLFDLDDDDLIDLARADRRPSESLSEVLCRRGPGHPRFAEPLARLERWRDLAGRVPPFELFMGVLAADGGRRRFLARLGSEADDVLDEFMALALAADRGPPVSLGRFLEEVATAAPEIKRELDESRDEIRVMTVHGAKGLEAPVVFLVDGGAAPVHSSHDPDLVTLAVPGAPPGAAPALVWNRKPTPRRVIEERDRLREEALGEYHRLLYVALTRAGDRLYLCGLAPASGPAPGCWYEVVRTALAADAEVVSTAEGEPILRWRATPASAAIRDTAAPVPEPAGAAPPVALGLPSWIAAPPPSVAPPRRITPSAALAERDRAGPLPEIDPRDRLAAASGDRERRRGILVHRLLERLPARPPADRAAAARRFLDARAADLTPTERDEIAREVLAVLAESEFAAIFGEEARAEVPIVGRLVDRRGEVVEVSGRIDRLVVGEREVRVIDFKSDRHPAGSAVPESYVGQMALYRRLLQPMFPDRAIRAFLLWTTGPALDEISTEALDAADRPLAAT